MVVGEDVSNMMLQRAQTWATRIVSAFSNYIRITITEFAKTRN